MPVEVDTFSLIDHQLIALVIVALLLAACEIGYRLGLTQQGAPDSLRTLMTGIGGAMLGLLGLLLGFAQGSSRSHSATSSGRRCVRIPQHVSHWAGLETTLTFCKQHSANGLIDLHELRLASLQNQLPSALFYLLLSLAALSVAFLAWSFGAAPHRGRAPMIMLALLLGAVLLLNMDVNRPQRGIIEVGVASLVRAHKSISAPMH